MVGRPAMMYGSEMVAPTKRPEAELELVDLKMLRVLLGPNRQD